ncbi:MULTISPECIES: hypothetical protein [Alteromonas]|jgi:hypothetical protein|uniref:DUF4342 domain-containing protein n=1 Tax=Alteromonas macleodii TaxID=28108 RepID=A0AB36FKB5_ALTMA|nr:hypothetical protein [Alteromonas macleodii]OES23855.1 hypothetical protein BFV95_4940 [Alteromonas macleodii]OES24561.1 hypothetical protein BFV94_4712 [Alteromonas macleodii]OES25159.1 hypothetical protein BFV93_4490 [Alteromonas macleodii]OES38481.1 hypothetical protein BFV96_4892 [Alteromonas macleodii]|tara:strand:- start:77 stop:382 length:306 start_codon:yes stop_codon:yes gene_type:complete
MQADYKLLVEYKKMVEQVSSVYGERTKDSMHSFIDTTLVGETKKWKKISIGFVVAGILLSPLLLGIPLILGGLVLYYLVTKKMERRIEQVRELVDNDKSLA